MPSKITVAPSNNPKRFYDFAYKSEAKTYRIDYAPWAEDNHTITSVTATLKAGSATIGTVTLASNVASFLITTPEISGALIEIKANTGTEIYIAYLDIIVRDPTTQYDNDYGMQ